MSTFRKYSTHITILLGLLIALLALIFIPFPRRVPDGAPSNYYVVIEDINIIKPNIFLIGSEDLISDNILYSKFEKISNLPTINNGKPTFVVIDLSTVDELSDADVDLIRELYYEQCYYIMILNYSESRNIKLNDDIEFEDRASNFFVLDYTSCEGIHYTTNVTVDYKNLYQFQYVVMHTIRNKLNLLDIEE